MTDAQTVSVYDAQAEAYADRFGREIPKDLEDFARLLPERADVLDLGCGPGVMAGWLAAQGFNVEAWDASVEMIRRTAAQPDVAVRHATFDELRGTDVYHGIWASFSLLHAPRAALPDLIDRMAEALRPGGVLYIAMKVGSGSKRDRLGRRYTFVSTEELTGWIVAAGLVPSAIRHGAARGLAGTEDPFVTVTARA